MNLHGEINDINYSSMLLYKALEIQKEASDFGFEWNDAIGILNKIREELDEIEQEINAQDVGKLKKEIEDLYLVSLHLAQYLKLDPMECLSLSYETFRRRWEKVQSLVTVLPESPGERLEYLESLWTKVKQEE
ncbi:MAG TPA: MazG nucleotide pyrophosphohydrolase domain-containing protein [Candidatus Hydrogenedens sp.]|nr:MazG nucleotide pyrophosphohydrolase domain-containing protein [Candidatus Hydrogenedens sp.]